MASVVTFSGLASGIDSSSIIESLISQQKKLRVAPLDEKITVIQETNSALSELTSLLDSLKEKVQKFRTLNGGAIARTATSSDESVASATAAGGASAGAYDITVVQTAKSGTLSFNDRFAGTDSKVYAGINDLASQADRTVTVSIGSGSQEEDVAVVVNSGTTVSDFVSQFNQTSTKAVASVVNVGTTSSPSYAVVINSNNQGLDQGSVAVSVGSAVTNGGAGAFNATTISQARNAELTVSGITGTISRPSNTISDVIPGLTLELNKAGAAKVTVTNEPESTTAAVQDFVDAFNKIVEFVAENDTIVREENGGEVKNVFGPLAGTSLDNQILSALRDALSNSRQPGGTVTGLADLGVTTERDGTLKFDSTKIATALSSDSAGFLAVTASLGESLGAVGGTIDQFTRFGGIIDQSEQSGEQQVSDLNSRKADAEKSISAYEAQLVAKYAHLEQIIGKLNSQSGSLSALGGR